MLADPVQLNVNIKCGCACCLALLSIHRTICACIFRRCIASSVWEYLRRYSHTEPAGNVSLRSTYAKIPLCTASSDVLAAHVTQIQSLSEMFAMYRLCYSARVQIGFHKHRHQAMTKKERRTRMLYTCLCHHH